MVVSLAPTSLSSPTAPPPIHVLISRQTYLYLGLQSTIRRLHPFAPTTFSFSGGTAVVRNEPEPGHESDGDDQGKKATQPNKSPSRQQREQKEEYHCPICWFEDEESQLPLRWHLFAGVLYDLVHHQSNKASLLPWRLRLHFTNYPDSILLPLSAGQVEAQIRSILQNSLKQAITLRTGQSKAALQLLTKESYQMLWQALQQQDSGSSSGRYYNLYRQVANDLSSKLGTGSGTNPESSSSLSKKNSRIPIRLLLGQSHTSIQKSCLATRELTLKQLLLKWLPSKYYQDNHSLAEGLICLVQGIEPPLETSVLELWQYLCHADHFLYIIVHVQTVE